MDVLDLDCCDGLDGCSERILQLLTNQHSSLVKVLGGTSGREIEKATACTNLGMAWQELSGETKEGPHILLGCAYYLELTLAGDLVDAGSHMIAPFCKVDQMWVSDESTCKDHLSTAQLRAFGIHRTRTSG
jgi:hypothetical protein